MSKMGINLFCFSYAGGSASAYYRWKSKLLPFIELIPVELPGHGNRIGQPFADSVMDAAPDLYSQIKPRLQEGPYLLFGHSMGCIMVYEVVKIIVANNDPSPEHVIVSGRLPPDYTESKRIHDAPLAVFRKEVMSMGGIPNEVFDITELYNIYHPILRADYRILELYEYEQERHQSIPCSLSVFMGDKEDITEDNSMLHWKEFTNGDCDFRTFPGNHFFIFQSIPEVTSAINQIVATLLIK